IETERRIEREVEDRDAESCYSLRVSLLTAAPRPVGCRQRRKPRQHSQRNPARRPDPLAIYRVFESEGDAERERDRADPINPGQADFRLEPRRLSNRRRQWKLGRRGWRRLNRYKGRNLDARRGWRWSRSRCARNAQRVFDSFQPAIRLFLSLQ